MSNYDTDEALDDRFNTLWLDTADMRQNSNNQFLRLESRLNALERALRAIEDIGKRLSIVEQRLGQ